jgi:hypothetical protein
VWQDAERWLPRRWPAETVNVSWFSWGQRNGRVNPVSIRAGVSRASAPTASAPTTAPTISATRIVMPGMPRLVQ